MHHRTFRSVPLRARPRRAIGLLFACAALIAGPAAAYSPDDPGPVIGGAVAVGEAHTQDGPRLHTRLQGWLPAPLLGLGPLRLGLEGSFGIEGAEDGGPCHFGDAAGADATPSIHRSCIEMGLGARALLGAEWGADYVLRLEGGVGGVWRQARTLDTNTRQDSRWSSTLVGRAVALISTGGALGGSWRFGLSAEASSVDVAAPALAGGLVFEAVIID